jgi:condensin complex subunit 1
MLVAICKSPGLYPDPGLRAAAVLSLSKFMCASQQYAAEHLQLFFTIMQESPESSIRANCVLAVGDLAFRFANLLEP